MHNNYDPHLYHDPYYHSINNIHITMNEHTRIIQRNVILITNLSSKICNKSILKSNKWFGKFGEIKQIYIDYYNQWAFIMYFDKISAIQAIKEMNNYQLKNGNFIKINHGINKYCKYFLNYKKCPYKNCVNVHHAANPMDIITENHKNDNNTFTNNQQTQIINHLHLNESPCYYSEHEYSNSSLSTSERIPDGDDQEIQDEMEIKTEYQQTLKKLQTENDALRQENKRLKQQKQQKEQSKQTENTEIDRLRKQNKTNLEIIKNLKENTKNLQSDYLGIIEELELKLQFASNNNHYGHGWMKENHRLKQDLRFQQIQYQLLQNDYYRIWQQLEAMELSTANKYLRYKNKYHFIHNKYRKLKQKTGYKSWDWLDLYEWINTIRNNRFSIYNEELSIKLKQENIDGIKLEEMNENDLKLIGIENEEDQIILMHEIKKLIGKNCDIEGYQDNDHTIDLEGDC